MDLNELDDNPDYRAAMAAAMRANFVNRMNGTYDRVLAERTLDDLYELVAITLDQPEMAYRLLWRFVEIEDILSRKVAR